MFVLKLCFGFSGRISRAKYWLGLAIAFWIVLLGGMSSRLVPSVSASLIIVLAFSLAFLVSALAVAVKRLHDLDISGWWAFGFLIAWHLTVGVFELAHKPPSFGAAISALLFAGVIWLGSAEGQQRENRFGAEPIARTRKRTEETSLSQANTDKGLKASPSSLNKNSPMRRPLLWLSLACTGIWLSLAAWDGAQHWSDDLVWHEHPPASWGDQHPECRDRFGFWPDGSRMDAEEFKEFIGGFFVRDFFIDDLKRRGEYNSEHEARDKWASTIRQKVADCEEAQWLPEAREAAITKQRIGLIAFAFLPPIIIFLVGVSGIWIWRRYANWVWQRHVRGRWLGLPVHLRRGLQRLYLVISVPWVAWFGYRLLDAGSLHYWRWPYISRDLWLLLIVPVGGPILLIVIIWVIEGFQKSGWQVEKPQHTPNADEVPSEPISAVSRSAEDYYAIINRAVSALLSNDRANRHQVYDRVRAVFKTELRGTDRLRIKNERKALEKAIRKVEDEAAARQRNEKGSRRHQRSFLSAHYC